MCSSCSVWKSNLRDWLAGWDRGEQTILSPHRMGLMMFPDAWNVVSTGGNKGIGYYIVQQIAAGDKGMTVLLGARDAEKGAEAVKKLNQSNVKPIVIDIDSHASIAAAASQVKETYGGLDILVNNAGMAFKGDAFDENVVQTTFKTNHYGTIDVIETFKPILRAGGKIINVSSMASVSALQKMSDANRKRAFAATTIEEVTKLLDDFRESVKKGTHKQDGWPETAYGMSVSLPTLAAVVSGMRAVF